MDIIHILLDINYSLPRESASPSAQSQVLIKALSVVFAIVRRLTEIYPSSGDNVGAMNDATFTWLRELQPGVPYGGFPAHAQTKRYVTFMTRIRRS